MPLCHFHSFCDVFAFCSLQKVPFRTVVEPVLLCAFLRGTCAAHLPIVFSSIRRHRQNKHIWLCVSQCLDLSCSSRCHGAAQRWSSVQRRILWGFFRKVLLLRSVDSSRRDEQTFSSGMCCTLRRSVPRGDVGGQRLVGTGLLYRFLKSLFGGQRGRTLFSCSSCHPSSQF